MLELSAFGPQGPWWLLAAGLPDNGKHQWTVPETGSDNVYLKITVSDGFNTASAITAMPLTIFGLPTKVRNNDAGASQQVILFPNPGNDLINIRSTSPIGELRIYDRFGACVVQSKHPSGQINSGNLQKGTYFFEAVLDNGIRKAGKWIKISDQ